MLSRVCILPKFGSFIREINRSSQVLTKKVQIDKEITTELARDETPAASNTSQKLNVKTNKAAFNNSKKENKLSNTINNLNRTPKQNDATLNNKSDKFKLQNVKINDASSYKNIVEKLDVNSNSLKNLLTNVKVKIV